MENSKLVYQKLIKSKKGGDTPTDELKRIIGIVEDIRTHALQSRTIDIAVIEGLAFMVKNATSLTQLAGLNYFVRSMLWADGIPFVIVAPTSLKKFIAGNGAVKKDVILMEIFKKYNETIFDDNVADAYGLAIIGSSLVGEHVRPLAEYQKEVINLLKKQNETKQYKEDGIE